MRRSIQAATVLALLMGLPQVGNAAEDEAVAIVNKAMKAHFPKGVDTKNQGVHTKSKGTLHIMGLDLDFNQESFVQIPSKFKETSEVTFMNMKINSIVVFNGKEAWLRANNMDVPVSDDMLAEFKDAGYMMGIMQGLFLKDKTVKLALVGDSKVKDKPAVVVSISREGKRQINLSIDKQTNLIVKIEMRKKNLQSGQEVSEERVITEFQDIAGRKVAKKIEILQDGKPYMELEVLEIATLEKIDDSEFAKPQ